MGVSLSYVQPSEHEEPGEPPWPGKGKRGGIIQPRKREKRKGKRPRPPKSQARELFDFGRPMGKVKGGKRERKPVSSSSCGGGKIGSQSTEKREGRYRDKWELL